MKYFSNISYEFYLVQYPVIFLFEAIVLKDIIKIPIIIGITLIGSILLHLVFQKKKVLLI